MTLVLHVSDPHFGTEVAAVVADLEAFAEALRPDVLVVSGDVTQRARRAQFAAARAFVDRLGIAERVVLPGNHDIPLYNLAARAFVPYRGYRRAFAAEHGRDVVRDDLCLVAVDTTRRWRHVDGTLSGQQVEAVVDRMRVAGERQLRVVVVHQPIAVDRHGERHNLLHGREAALRRWADAGVDLVVGGHVHLPFAVPGHGIDAAGVGAAGDRAGGTAPGPAGSGAPWAVHAGTAVSSRTRSGIPNSVLVWRVASAPEAARSVTIERHDHAPGRGFSRVGHTTLRFGPGAGPGLAGEPLRSTVMAVPA